MGCKRELKGKGSEADKKKKAREEKKDVISEERGGKVWKMRR